MNRNTYILVALLASALIFRVYLSLMGSHVDLLSNGEWGKWIYQNGSEGFYENQVWTYSWPTQPPLVNIIYSSAYSLYETLVWAFANIGVMIATLHLIPTKMIWYFDFIKWFESTFYSSTNLKFGFLLTMKFFAILGDILIGLLVFLLARKKGLKKAVLFFAAFLFLPFSWYLSSLWGQYDQLAYFFLLASFCLVTSRFFYVAPMLFALSIGIKPTALIFAPLFLWLYIFRNQKPGVKAFGLLAAAAVFVSLALPFTEKNVFEFLKNDLISKVFYKSEFRVGSSSFNFWRILIGDKLMNHETVFLFLPAKVWGYLSFLALNAVAFKLTFKKSAGSLFGAMFIVGMGSWLFMTNMLERYLFAGVASGLFAAIYSRKLIKYWVIISVIFSLNLYYSWLFPPELDFLRQVFLWQDGLVTKILSVVNILVFFKMAWIIYHKEKVLR